MRQPQHILKLVFCWLTLPVSQTIASEVISQDELPPLAQPGKGPIVLAEQIFPSNTSQPRSAMRRLLSKHQRDWSPPGSPERVRKTLT